MSQIFEPTFVGFKHGTRLIARGNRRRRHRCTNDTDTGNQSSMGRTAGLFSGISAGKRRHFSKDQHNTEKRKRIACTGVYPESAEEAAPKAKKQGSAGCIGAGTGTGFLGVSWQGEDTLPVWSDVPSAA